MNELKTWRSSRPFGVVLCALFCLSLFGCRAPEEIKQGYVGEYCFEDEDCRDGLLCDDTRAVCMALRVGSLEKCEAMCERMDLCGAPQDRCLTACHNTVRDWSEASFDLFAACITSDLSCEEMRTSYAPQTCYLRLPLDEQRSDVCASFVESSMTCDQDGAALSSLRDSCLLVARTGTDESWAPVEACKARLSGGSCTDIATCLNDALSLSPALAL